MSVGASAILQGKNFQSGSSQYKKNFINKKPNGNAKGYKSFGP